MVSAFLLSVAQASNPKTVGAEKAAWGGWDTSAEGRGQRAEARLMWREELPRRGLLAGAGDVEVEIEACAIFFRAG